MPVPICEVHLMGKVLYNQAWELQGELAAQVAEGARPPTLLLLEHSPTYTFGRRGKAENLLWDEAERAKRGIEVHWVDRGGDVTFHGPGQLVGYPILPLAPGGLQMKSENGSGNPPRADYVGYIRKLEEMLIKTLAEFGLVTGQIPGMTGVWVQPNVASRCRHCPPEAKLRPSKIAAIGVKVDARGVSRHGFALNVAPDMEYWNGIIGCGLEGYPIIRIADLLKEPPSITTVIEKLIPPFSQVFGYEMVRSSENLIHQMA